ncbi:hypothetical protein O3Q51_14460 [Cryomorphaceae bacterium 1068]|nr:hypothetical protein [Cryomorphaceae bacterium 1068]
MKPIPIQTIREKAIEVLHGSCLPQGIAASAQQADNYRRIWARDGIMTGITGITIGDEYIIEHLAKTIHYLGQYQDQSGIIPSNVGVESKPTVSFGSTAGRVDATAWWIIGALLLLKDYPQLLKNVENLEEKVLKAIGVMEIWEMNLGNLIYTPIGGNWADEYVIQGHTLYDNTLRLWGLKLAASVLADKQLTDKAGRVEEKIKQNFWYSTDHDTPRYHKEAYARVGRDPGYLFASIGPMGYDTRWDCAGNALGLLLGFTEKKDQTEAFLHGLSEDLPERLIPAFWPVIEPKDAEWSFLKDNYNYRFKNKPYHFHNGGSWPIFSGLMCLAMAYQEKPEIATLIHESMTKALEREEPAYRFFEYFDTEKGQAQGVQQLCYSASGWLLSDLAVSGDFDRLKHILS